MTMIQINDILNEKKIADLVEPVQIMGYEESGSWRDKYFCQWHSCNLDKNEDFYTAMQNTTQWHSYEWEAKWEHEHVYENIEPCIKSRLHEEGFYQGYCKFNRKDGTKRKEYLKAEVDTTQCGHHIELEPTIISALNIDQIKRCLHDAAHDITWMIAESWQLMLQCTNPCEWDGKPPRTRYGNGWLADPKTRVIYMEHENRIDETMFKRLLYRRHTLDVSHGYLTEYDRNGDEYYEK